MDKFLYGAAALLMIVVIAYGGTYLFQFLFEFFKKTL